MFIIIVVVVILPHLLFPTIGEIREGFVINIVEPQ